MEYKYKTIKDIHSDEEFKQKKAIFEKTDNIFDMFEMYWYVFDRLVDCEEYHKSLEEYFNQFVDIKDIERGEPFLGFDKAEVVLLEGSPYVDERKAFTPIQINNRIKPIKLAFVGENEKQGE